MKTIVCTCCGRKIEVGEETTLGQHILCPYCGRKFSYIVDEPPFSSARLEYALSERCKDPKDDLYYSRAPKGARLYIAMIFYGKVFGQDIDRDKFFGALSEIEPQLDVQDIEYLIANEESEELKIHFLRLLSQRNYISPGGAVPETPHSNTEERVRQEQKRDAVRDRRQRASAVLENREIRQKIFGMLATTACILAVMVVGLVMFKNWSEHVKEEKKIEAEREKARLEEERRQDEKELEERRLALEQKQINLKLRHERSKENSKIHENVNLLKSKVDVKEKDPDESSPSRKLEGKQSNASDVKRTTGEIVVDKGAHYKEAVAAFACRRISFWDDLPSNRRPGEIEQTAFCALPSDSREGNDLYELRRGEDGRREIKRLTSDGSTVKITDSEFEEKINVHGGLYAFDGKVVVRAKSPITAGALEISKEGDAVIIGERVYGSLFPLMRKYKVDLSTDRFAVEMSCGERRINVATVAADEDLNSKLFFEAAKHCLIQEKQEKIGPQNVSVRKPRLTVVFYNGDRIQKVAGGITRIPDRNPYENVDKSCSRSYWRSAERCTCVGCKNKRAELKFLQQWEPLKEKAEEQTREQEDYQVELQKAIDLAKQRVTVSEQEIRRFLKRFKVSFRHLPAGCTQEKVAPASVIEDDFCNIPSWKGDMVPNVILNQINADLKVGSFCGISFGTTDGSNGGLLRQPFRGFDRYDVARSRLQRVNRVSIHREIEGGADAESIRRELRNIASALERKYVVEFDLRNSSDDRVEYCAVTSDFEINVNGNLNGTVYLNIDFYNRQVNRQDDKLEMKKQKPSIDRPIGADESVL